MGKEKNSFKYPGTPMAMDGTEAVVRMESAGSEAGGVYPITPASNMGEGFSASAAAGTPNVFGRKLIFFEPEGEHAAAAVTAGMSIVGMRSTNFSAGQGIAYMHESLYAAVGKRLTYVLNIACRAITKHSLNIHCGHDDYHSVDDTGFFQLFGKNVQEVADLNLITHRVAELSLNPGICAQDGFLTSHVIESLALPELELVKEYLGDPSDIIECPTPAQKMIFGETRRRVPELFDLDYPAMLGTVQNQDSYAQGVAAQRPFFFDHIKELTEIAFDEFYKLTGRRYSRAAGYRLEDAEYVVIGQGSVVWNLEAVCDFLRETAGIKIGILNLIMFRPFPSDLISRMLRGKKGVTVLERVDQPLASDAPLLREVRGAVQKAQENYRAVNGTLPYPDVDSYGYDEAPDFYSGSFGLGSRDTQAGDYIAAVNNMTSGKGRRFFYLGIDFIRDNPINKLGEHQDEITAGYPGVKEMALEPAENSNLLPKDAMSFRMHSIGGWGAITTGKNMAMTISDLLGMKVKANPKYGSEKKGQPTTFYSSLSRDDIRMNCDLKFVDVVLSPDPNVFRHSNPLSGLIKNGVFIIQSTLSENELWGSLPDWAKKSIRDNELRVYYIDAFAIARSEAPTIELQFRMQGAAFQGAFFAVSPLMAREKLTREPLFEAITKQINKKFLLKGSKVVESNVRVITRGYDEVKELDYKKLEKHKAELVSLDKPVTGLSPEGVTPGIGDRQRFFDQVYDLYRQGQEPIADPFAALSAIPAATGIFRDMTDIRFEVPEWDPRKCTGCGNCWTQCPDSAIPGLVIEFDKLLDTAIRSAGADQPLTELPELVDDLAAESRSLLDSVPDAVYADVLALAFKNVCKERGKAANQAVLDSEFARILDIIREFKVARTVPFFDVPEKKEKGSGGLLAVTINPYACKGCNLCVDACNDGALTPIKQEEGVVDALKKNWEFWKEIPDTPKRFIQVRDIHEGIGVLSTILLKKDNYAMMVGGDGACMGCGEKTSTRLLMSAIEASLQPHVTSFVEKLDELIKQVDSKARLLLAADVDLAGVKEGGRVDVSLDKEDSARLKKLTRLLTDLKDLSWRYKTGPSGVGRARLGMTNSTGCTSVWASTYPYNPYPFPWVNHLFQDSPSIAIGIFEGHMRKMADNFALVRRADLEVNDAYKPDEHDEFFSSFDYNQFTNDEFLLCPPIVAMGGDGAMYDIGFQNLSRLMASGKPLRVVILDTQVYSNTGGQACTSGFTGQISDMSYYGKAQHGKTEARKELSLISVAHRTSYVLQSSQANPSHLMAGILKGLASRRPAIFNIYAPCQTEHGIPDDASLRSARLALESRAVPYMVYDPDAGSSLSERLDLDGNPEIDQDWPAYELKYKDENGKDQVMELPMTIADWAATEVRFAKHFLKVRGTPDTELVLYHEYLKFSQEEAAGKSAFIYVLTPKGQLDRYVVSAEMVTLGRERLDFWNELREMSGDRISEEVREKVSEEKEAEFEAKLEAVKARYEAQIESLKQSYPQEVARKMAEALMGQGSNLDNFVSSVVSAPAAPAPAAPALAPAPAAEAVAPEEEAEPGMAPWIEEDTCTACGDCLKVNPKLFVYGESGKAIVTDPKKGTFKDLVVAAERCPSGSIHPGEPTNKKEKNLDKLIARAEPFI